MKSHLTNFGIPGVGVVPYGVHLCHFYPKPQDLIDGLIPYFSAGLANNERCICVASSPLPAEEIRKQVANVPELEKAVATRQLIIADADEWFGAPEALKPDEVVKRWIDEEARALAEGFEGLRLAGDTNFVSRANWGRFMEYEASLNEALKNRRIVVCCCYAREKCRPVDFLEVVHCHHGALDRDDLHWQIFFQTRSGTRIANQNGLKAAGSGLSRAG
jgi:hypothetical protein